MFEKLTKILGNKILKEKFSALFFSEKEYQLKAKFIFINIYPVRPTQWNS